VNTDNRMSDLCSLPELAPLPDAMPLPDLVKLPKKLAPEFVRPDDSIPYHGMRMTASEFVERTTLIPQKYVDEFMTRAQTQLDKSLFKRMRDSALEAQQMFAQPKYKYEAFVPKPTLGVLS